MIAYNKSDTFVCVCVHACTCVFDSGVAYQTGSPSSFSGLTTLTGWQCMSQWLSKCIPRCRKSRLWTSGAPIHRPSIIIGWFMRMSSACVAQRLLLLFYSHCVRSPHPRGNPDASAMSKFNAISERCQVCVLQHMPWKDAGKNGLKSLKSTVNMTFEEQTHGATWWAFTAHGSELKRRRGACQTAANTSRTRLHMPVQAWPLKG